MAWTLLINASIFLTLAGLLRCTLSSEAVKYDEGEDNNSGTADLAWQCSTVMAFIDYLLFWHTQEYSKVLNFRTLENLAVINLKFKQRCQILGYFTKKVQMEQSGLGLHCLPRHVCLKT